MAIGSSPNHHIPPPSTPFSLVSSASWIIDLRDKAHLTAPLRDFAEYTDITVYTVPQHLYDVFPRAFTPGILRVGPGSGRTVEQMGMDYHKKRLLKEVASRHRKLVARSVPDPDPAGVFQLDYCPDSKRPDELIAMVIDNAGGLPVHEARRKCYECSTADLDDDSWRDILVMDAIFVAAWLYHLTQDHFEEKQRSYFYEFFRGKGMRSYLTLMRTDVMLMENQIPMQLLKAALKTLYPLARYEGLSIKDSILNYYHPPAQPAAASPISDEFYDLLPDVLLHWSMSSLTPFSTPKIHFGGGRDSYQDYFIEDLQSHVRRRANMVDSHSSQPLTYHEPNHILDYIYKELCGSRDEVRSYARLRPVYIPSASSLAAVGVNFKVYQWGSSAMGGLQHIRLERKQLSWWCCRCPIWTLYLPELHLSDSSTPMMINLLAYETVTKDTFYLRSVAFVMNRLIQSEEDVDVLKDRLILHGDVISNRKTVECFNMMSTDIDVAMLKQTREGFQDFMDTYYNYFKMRALGSIKFRFSRHTAVWVWVSGILAFLLLALTVLQVGLAIKPV